MPTIALVDDDRNILTSVSIALEAEGYRIMTYTDGASALEGFKTSPPDLAILDIKMPRMDGMELLRRLRQKTDMPVIFLTSKDEEIDELFGLKMGADDYIAKPFSPRELVARMKAVMRRVEPQPTEDKVVLGDVVLDVHRRVDDVEARDPEPDDAEQPERLQGQRVGDRDDRRPRPGVHAGRRRLAERRAVGRRGRRRHLGDIAHLRRQVRGHRVDGFGQVLPHAGHAGHLRLAVLQHEAWDAPSLHLGRADGTPVYMLSVVVDDYDMGVTHVIRGEDHLSNTSKHVALFQAFGVEPPKYAHIPLILNADGSKMSKRDKGASMTSYMDDGFLAEAVNMSLRCLVVGISTFPSPLTLKNSSGFEMQLYLWSISLFW